MAKPAISNQTPDASSITWEAFNIAYLGNGYAVPAGSTNQKWTWWRFNGGNPLVESGAEVPADLNADDLVLFVNRNGIGVRVQSSSFIDGELLVDGSIFADALASNILVTRHVSTIGLDAAVIKFGEMHGDRIGVNTIASKHVVTVGLDAQVIRFGEMSGDRIAVNTIATKHVVTVGLDAQVIRFGEMHGDRIAVNTLASKHVVTEGLDAALIRFGEMHGDRVMVKTIKANHFESNVILVNERIAALGSSGQSVELNPEGFFVYGPNGPNGSRPTYVAFPTEGGTTSTARPNIISGTLQATTLSVEGNPDTGQAATFRRNSQIEPGATLTLNDEIVAPVAGPTAESVTNVVRATQTSADGVIGDTFGAAYRSSDNSVYFLAVETVSNNNYKTRLYRSSLTNDTVYLVKTFTNYNSASNAFGTGVVFIGSNLYILWEYGTQIGLARYDPANGYSQTASLNIGSNTTSTTLGTDGTDLWVADLGGSNNAFRFRRYLAAMSSASTQETVNTTKIPIISSKGVAYNNLYSLIVGSMDFGARKFVVTYNDALDEEQFMPPTLQYDMTTISTSGSAETVNTFALMRGNTRPSLAWVGADSQDTAGYFVGLSQTSDYIDVSRYSKIRLSANSDRAAIWYVGTSYYRSSDGAETVVSPLSRLSMKSRWFWKTTIMAGPTNVGARIYISPSNSASQTSLQTSLDAGVTSYLGTTWNQNGSVSKTTSTFTSSTPATIVSQAVAARNMQISTTSGSRNISPVGLAVKFYEYMIGRTISGTGIPAGTVIASVSSTTAATLSNAATATSTAVRQIMLPKVEIRGDGVARIREIERLIITSFEDADLTSTNEPPLRIGDINGSHLRIDSNEILSLQNSTDMSPLLLNSGGTTSLAGGRLYRVSEITNDQGPLAINVSNGQLVIGGNANFAARLQHPSAHGAIVWQDGDVKITNNSYVNTATNSTNTRQLWCDRVSAYRAYNNLSDASVKDDITDIPSATETFKSLRPRLYKRNDYRRTDPRYLSQEYGFVAQEVQEVLPAAVTAMGNGLLGLQYQAIFTVGMAALAELIDKVERMTPTEEPAA